MVVVRDMRYPICQCDRLGREREQPFYPSGVTYTY